MRFIRPLFVGATLLLASTAFAKNISIDLASKTTNTASADRCDLVFNITNNSYGTVHYAKIPFTASDKSGNQIKFYGFSHIENRSRYKNEAITKGSTLTTSKIHLDAKCSSLDNLAIDHNKVDETSCNIRNMPEKASCKDLFTLKSDTVKTASKASSKQKPSAANKSTNASYGKGCHATAKLMLKAAIQKGWITSNEAANEVKSCKTDSLVTFKNTKSLYLQKGGQVLGYSKGKYTVYPEVCWDLMTGSVYRNKGGYICKP